VCGERSAREAGDSNEAVEEMQGCHGLNWQLARGFATAAATNK